MSKVVRDGKVAVFVSGGFGAGWSTWASDEGWDFIYGDERSVELVEKQDFVLLEKYIEEHVSDAYLGGMDGLYIQWVDEGTKFYIDEYDGAEALVTIEDIAWEVA